MVTKPAAKTPAIPIKVKKAMINTSRLVNKLIVLTTSARRRVKLRANSFKARLSREDMGKS
jgi:hypothetical protein